MATKQNQQSLSDVVHEIRRASDQQLKVLSDISDKLSSSAVMPSPGVPGVIGTKPPGRRPVNRRNRRGAASRKGEVSLSKSDAVTVSKPVVNTETQGVSIAETKKQEPLEPVELSSKPLEELPGKVENAIKAGLKATKSVACAKAEKPLRQVPTKVVAKSESKPSSDPQYTYSTHEMATTKKAVIKESVKELKKLTKDKSGRLRRENGTFANKSEREAYEREQAKKSDKKSGDDKPKESTMVKLFKFFNSFKGKSNEAGDTAGVAAGSTLWYAAKEAHQLGKSAKEAKNEALAKVKAYKKKRAKIKQDKESKSTADDKPTQARTTKEKGNAPEKVGKVADLKAEKAKKDQQSSLTSPTQEPAQGKISKETQAKTKPNQKHVSTAESQATPARATKENKATPSEASKLSALSEERLNKAQLSALKEQTHKDESYHKVILKHLEDMTEKLSKIGGRSSDSDSDSLGDWLGDAEEKNEKRKKPGKKRRHNRRRRSRGKRGRFKSVFSKLGGFKEGVSRRGTSIFGKAASKIGSVGRLAGDALDVINGGPASIISKVAGSAMGGIGGALGGIGGALGGVGGALGSGLGMAAKGVGKFVPFLAPAMAAMDAYNGFTDTKKQQETFGLKDGQEATLGQKSSMALGSVLNMGGLVSGTAGLLGSGLGALGFDGAQKALSFDSGDMAKGIYSFFGGDSEPQQVDPKEANAIANAQPAKTMATTANPQQSSVITTSTANEQSLSSASPAVNDKSNERVSDLMAEKDAKELSKSDKAQNVGLDKKSIDALSKAISTTNAVTSKVSPPVTNAKTQPKATAYKPANTIPNDFRDGSLQRLSADLE